VNDVVVNGDAATRTQRTGENAAQRNVSDVDVVTDPVHGHAVYLTEPFATRHAGRVGQVTSQQPVISTLWGNTADCASGRCVALFG